MEAPRISGDFTNHSKERVRLVRALGIAMSGINIHSAVYTDTNMDKATDTDTDMDTDIETDTNTDTPTGTDTDTETDSETEMAKFLLRIYTALWSQYRPMDTG